MAAFLWILFNSNFSASPPDPLNIRLINFVINENKKAYQTIGFLTLSIVIITYF